MGVVDVKTGADTPDIDLQISAYLYLANFGQDTGLEFDPEPHQFLGDRVPVLSTTTVLKLARMTPDYSNRDPWYASRGSATHLAIHRHEQGVFDEDSIDDAVRPYFDAYLRYKDETSITVVETEVMRWCPKYRFAGIIDQIVEGQSSYKLFLTGKGKYKLKEVKNIQSNFNYFLSALVAIGGDHNGAGKDIAKLNVEVWRRRNLKGGNNG